MSEESSSALPRVAGIVFIGFLIVLVAIGAYTIGRNSVSHTSPSTVEVDDVDTSIDLEVNGEDSAVSLPVVANASKEEDQSDTNENGQISEEQNAKDDALSVTESSHMAEQSKPGEDDTDGELIGDRLELNSEDMAILFEVWDVVDQIFDGELPGKEELTYGAIAGSLETLGDEHTRFLPPAVAQRAREQLEGFEGIGAFVDLSEEGYLLIVAPIRGQPAEFAGLKRDDIVTQVDGQQIKGMALEEIIALVKGPEGTEVTLTIVREGVEEPFDLTVVRALIETPVVESEMLQDDIAYVRLSSFSSDAIEQLSEQVDTLLAENPVGMILDLRDNRGGFLNQAVAVSDLFLPEGIVVIQRDSSGAEEVFESHDGDIAEAIPLVVLVNSASASASEIVAGAVQDLGRGTLIGELTFGKGSVQLSRTLSDGSELRVTIARWYTPDNTSIDHEGVRPDIELDPPEEYGTENDTQLQRAIEFFLNGK